MRISKGSLKRNVAVTASPLPMRISTAEVTARPQTNVRIADVYVLNGKESNMAHMIACIVVAMICAVILTRDTKEKPPHDGEDDMFE